MASESRQSAAALIEAQDRFVAVWGQMGAAWGISRTMADCVDDVSSPRQ